MKLPIFYLSAMHAPNATVLALALVALCLFAVVTGSNMLAVAGGLALTIAFVLMGAAVICYAVRAVLVAVLTVALIAKRIGRFARRIS